MTEARIGNYVVISPVKDEGPYVEKTILSMSAQTLRPRRWIIVDDSSRDATPQILRRYSEQFPWITVLTLIRDGGRKPGSAVIHAFMAGYKEVKNDDFDFIVKLDCDLEIPVRYFERLIDRFDADPKLGIASGIYLEINQQSWKPVRMPDYHAAGCSKMVRAECFRQIGGFLPEGGWDTVDEIRALMLGWTTRHFTELQLRHLKIEGEGIGANRTHVMHGEIYYRTGGGFFFFLLKVIHRAVLGKPAVVGGFMMFLGYARAWWRGEPRLVSDTEADRYRRLLNTRVLTPGTGLLTRFKQNAR